MYTQKFTRTKYEFNTLAPYTVDSLPLEGAKGECCLEYSRIYVIMVACTAFHAEH